MTTHPTLVIGAGPVGLAAATHLHARGLPVLLAEAGPRAATHVRAWGHVRLFSPWSEVLDPVAVELLRSTGWVAPDPGATPDGREWADDYLEPLAAALATAGVDVSLDTRVVGVARRGRDLVVDDGRDTEPFTALLDGPDGVRRVVVAAVVDASGTFATPNPLGADGLPALGEAEHAGAIAYGVPDLADPAVRALHAGRHTVVAGTGASAQTTLVGLAALADEVPGTRVTWLVRRAAVGDAFGGGAADQLVERGALGRRARAAAEGPHVTTLVGFRVAEVAPGPGGRLRVLADDGRAVEGVDRVVTVTGYRPDRRLLAEVRLDLDPALEAPARLAPLIDPNVHSCGTVHPHGAAELAHPETGVFVVGAKSYGRAPTFLALTGYEQARSVAAHLAGDPEAAARVVLVLPETGVCGGAGLFEAAAAAPG
ncbi:FAD-dependent oxidoreductase [uncultured Nocardioides sp.]|uniref:FAD-dependent oxidoreductase n=1 Tax=uncultured Nocardioides sp. TaxID=198441 RepID=UPI0026154D9E|nr:FAD-dependent oxidoreductase [uncultured Nocardioides sp.]